MPNPNMDRIVADCLETLMRAGADGVLIGVADGSDIVLQVNVEDESAPLNAPLEDNEQAHLFFEDLVGTLLSHPGTASHLVGAVLRAVVQGIRQNEEWALDAFKFLAHVEESP